MCKKKYIQNIVLCFICTIILLSVNKTSHANPEEKTPDQVAIELQQIYSSFTSLQFDFSQVTDSGGRERHGNGNAIFFRPEEAVSEKNDALNQKRKPSIMRWNYSQPDMQVIINDGEKISIYTEKDKQLLITSAEEMESDITYAFLSGARNPLEDFKSDYPDARFHFKIPGVKLDTIQLTPRLPHSQVKAVHIWYDAQMIIRKLIIEDHFETTTQLTFSNIILNDLKEKEQAIVDTFIRFSPPEGTEIISQ